MDLASVAAAMPTPSTEATRMAVGVAVMQAAMASQVAAMALLPAAPAATASFSPEALALLQRPG
jgi:hypothetical protein